MSRRRSAARRDYHARAAGTACRPRRRNRIGNRISYPVPETAKLSPKPETPETCRNLSPKPETRNPRNLSKPVPETRNPKLKLPEMCPRNAKCEMPEMGFGCVTGFGTGFGILVIDVT